MNAYRILMIALGLSAFIPEAIFLWKLRTGRRAAENREIGLALRLGAIAFMANSLRIVIVYWSNPNAGATTSFTDHVISASLAALSAFATWVSLIVFLRIRKPVVRAKAH